MIEDSPHTAYTHISDENDAFIISIFPFENTDIANDMKTYIKTMQTQSFTLSTEKLNSFSALIAKGIKAAVINAGTVTALFLSSSVHLRNSYTAITESAAINILNTTVSE